MTAAETLEISLLKRENGSLLKLIGQLTVIDVFTGDVLGFNISRIHDANFVLVAIKRAVEGTATVLRMFPVEEGGR